MYLEILKYEEKKILFYLTHPSLMYYFRLTIYILIVYIKCVDVINLELNFN